MGIVVAVVVVLGGAGTGAYLLLRGGDEGLTSTTSSIVASTSVTIPLTATTVSGTTETLPPVTTSTSEAGDLETIQVYLQATKNLLTELLADDARLPVLAVKINATAPSVPRTVWDELQNMAGRLDAVYTSLGEVFVPPEFQEPHYWLEQAASAMGKRIDATIKGIEAMWAARTVNAGKPFFDIGRQARDEFRADLRKFEDTAPLD
ncbi:MAG: hypothetical protein H5T84_00755 [Thermoleophilia bacterium]|nr:hypothetical protein [Thermoleophilia bacterium]